MGKKPIDKKTTGKLKVESGVPMIGLRSDGVHIRHPKEFKLVEGMNISDSIAFDSKDKPFIESLRNAVRKVHKTRNFTIRAVDPKTGRMWRLDDKKKKSFGGNRYTGSLKKQSKKKK